MTTLPKGLADPLHLTYPIPWKLLIALAVLLVAGVLFALLRAWLKRPRPERVESTVSRSPTARTGIADAIEALRGRYRSAPALRPACHELSTLLRRHYETSSGRRYSTLTAGEIRDVLGETRGSRFFAFLAELQFGRLGPTQNDFDGACDLALEVARKDRR